MGKNIYTTTNIKYLTAGEFDELIETIKKTDFSSKFLQRNLTAFLLAEYCGLRASELGLLEFSDFDPKEKTIFCRRLKGSVSNKLKIVDLRVYDEMCRHYYQRLKQPSHSNRIFTSKTEQPINRRTLDTLMKYYCSFTSISEDKWHFHTLKHTRAMELVEMDNIDIRDVQWWLGHKYISNTMIYLNYSVKAQEKLYTKLINGQQR